MSNETRTDELLAYFDRLIAADKGGYLCQREISEVVSELRVELNIGSVNDAEKYLSEIHKACGDYHTKEKQLVNSQIFRAYFSGLSGEMYFRRGSGVSTSIEALKLVFGDVVYVESKRHQIPNVNDKVVFLEGGVDLPTGTRPKSVIKIRAIDVIDSKDLLDGRAMEIAHII